jgi:putative tryptophan/tyrosine transport system substrate-binding protein
MSGGFGASIASVSWQASAQSGNRRPLIGWLSSAPRAAVALPLSAMRDGFRELDYEEGRNLDIAYRFADNHFERLPALARELVQLAPDVLYAATTSSALALREATHVIPIVCATLQNEVRVGLVESHARPGRNVTGIAVAVDGLMGKHIELGTQVIPGATKLGFLANVSEAAIEYGARHQWHEADAAGVALSITMVRAEVRSPDDLVGAFDRLVREGSQAMIVPADAMFFTERRRLSDLVLAARLPSIYAIRDHVSEAGGLLSYGVSLRDDHRRAAALVVKILKGAKPGDLPIEFPTKLELVINLRTTKALGLTIPPTLLARADEVIE